MAKGGAMKEQTHKQHKQRAIGDKAVYPLAVNLTKAARMLSVSRPTLRKQILPFLDWQQVGTRILVSVESIKRFLQQPKITDEDQD
jgi:hypothetical protein